MDVMPQPAAMKFGREPQDPDTDPKSVEPAKRWAEVRCLKGHLVGVVTNDEVCLVRTDDCRPPPTRTWRSGFRPTHRPDRMENRMNNKSDTRVGTDSAQQP